MLLWPLLVRVTGLEPATFCLEGSGSTNWSYTRILSGAENETRTRNILLGRQGFYQLNYFRILEQSAGFEPASYTACLEYYIGSQ